MHQYGIGFCEFLGRPGPWRVIERRECVLRLEWPPQGNRNGTYHCYAYGIMNDGSYTHLRRTGDAVFGAFTPHSNRVKIAY